MASRSSRPLDLAGGDEVPVVAVRIEARPVLLPADLTQAGAAALARPEVHEHPAPLVVSRADAVEAVVRAGHSSPETSRHSRCFAGPYEIPPVGRPDHVDGTALDSRGWSAKPSPEEPDVRGARRPVSITTCHLVRGLRATHCGHGRRARGLRHGDGSHQALRPRAGATGAAGWFEQGRPPVPPRARLGLAPLGYGRGSPRADGAGGGTRGGSARGEVIRAGFRRSARQAQRTLGCHARSRVRT